MISLFHLRRGAARCAPSRHNLNLIALFSCLLLALSICGSSSALAQNKGNPTLEITFPNYLYSQSVDSLVEFDLRNGRLVLFDQDGEPDHAVYLKKGKYDRPYKDGFREYMELLWLKPLESESSETQFAIAKIVWVTGGASTNDDQLVQLLKLDQGHPKVVQQVYFNVRGSRKAGAFFNLKTNLLTIKAINCWEHACGTQLDVVQFKLENGLLKQMRYWHEPLPYYN